MLKFTNISGTMNELKLEILYTIIGIGSASGLHLEGSDLFVVSDNASVIYQFDTENRQLQSHKLYDSDVSENILKKQKPDLECLAYADAHLYAFGSGSTENRHKVYRFSPDTKKTETLDLSRLYSKMQQASGIDVSNFNLEGAFFAYDNWYFFQRGNGSDGQNGFFRCSDLSENATVKFTPVHLPKILENPCGFTDAVFKNGNCYFLAAAESSGSTYEDGDVGGSAIGKIDLKTGKVTGFFMLSGFLKFEGLTMIGETKEELAFLLCVDDDSDVLESKIYRLLLDKKEL